MKIFWKIVAALLAVAAVAWVVVENFDRAFLFATAGAIAWFLSYRAHLKEKLDRDDADRRNAMEEEAIEEDGNEEDL